MRRRELIILLGGAAAVRPLPARAQRAVPVVGFLSSVSAGPYAPFVAAFSKGLGDTGYVEGKNVTIEYRWAEGNYDRLPDLAADLVERKVDVIATSGGPPAALAAKHATSVIPIVFSSSDPVEHGLVASLARPEGNLTGISILSVDLNAKRFELISELVPQTGVIALLVNPDYSNTQSIIRNILEVARIKGIEVPVLKARNEGEINSAFDALAALHAGAMVVGSDPFLASRREQIAALAFRHAIPAIHEWKEAVLAGGLISYGTSLAGVYRQLGRYAGQILKGVKPGDLPVQQPTTFELVINFKTAKGLGLTVPQMLLGRADEVIE